MAATIADMAIRAVALNSYLLGSERENGEVLTRK